jgi:hypothetical protein
MQHILCINHHGGLCTVVAGAIPGNNVTQGFRRYFGVATVPPYQNFVGAKRSCLSYTSWPRGTHSNLSVLGVPNLTGSVAGRVYIAGISEKPRTISTAGQLPAIPRKWELSIQTDHARRAASLKCLPLLPHSRVAVILGGVEH